jgi:hypothetical protein
MEGDLNRSYGTPREEESADRRPGRGTGRFRPALGRCPRREVMLPLRRCALPRQPNNSIDA